MSKKNISENILASSLNITLNKLRRRERNVGEFKVNECEKMSQILDTSIDELILGTKFPSIDVSVLSMQQLDQVTSFVLNYTSLD